MPRNVRNFWLELEVDGGKSRVETGPRSKDGGFSLNILMRDNGGILRAMNVRGFERDGQLTLIAEIDREASQGIVNGLKVTRQR